MGALGDKVINRLMAKLPANLELVSSDQIPLLFHEIGIKHGYRKPGGSWLQYVWSAFAPLNNETLNIWTHFLPFWYNCAVFLSFLLDLSFARDPYHWPYLIYLLVAVMWPIVSCLAHVFGSMSLRSRHLCFLADYASLSLYSFGVGLAYHAYSFDRHFNSMSISPYYPIITACSAIFCTGVSAYSRIMPKIYFWRRKIARSLAFLIPYVLVNAPLAYRLWWHYVHDTGPLSSAVTGHMRQFMSITTAFSLYNSHCPERVWPGRFDLIGHSHQVFHIFGAFATYFQMWAIHTDMQAMRHINTSKVDTMDLMLFVVVLVVNCTIVLRVLYIVSPSTVEQPVADKHQQPEENNNLIQALNQPGADPNLKLKHQ